MSLPISTLRVPFLESTLPAASRASSRNPGDWVFAHLAALLPHRRCRNTFWSLSVSRFLFGYEILSRHGHPADAAHPWWRARRTRMILALVATDQGTGQTAGQPFIDRAAGRLPIIDFRDMPTKSGKP